MTPSFFLCRSFIIHFYIKPIFVFLNYLISRSYPIEISKKQKRTDFFSHFPMQYIEQPEHERVMFPKPYVFRSVYRKR